MLEKLRPLRDCILVQRIEDTEKKTKGGIYIPDVAKEDGPQIATVLAVGPGRRTSAGELIPMDIKAGDQVFFGKFAGSDAGKNLLILREDDILGVLEQQ